MAGADLKTYIPQITALNTEIGKGEVKEIDGCRLRDGTDAVLRNSKLYKPIIAAIDGPCVAGGMEMLGGIDIRVATPNARFGVMEPKRGLFAGGGTTVRLPQQVGFAAAMEFLLTAEALPAARAYELGLLNEICQPDELMDHAFAWAERILANGPLAVRSTKESVIRGMEVTMKEAYKIESELSQMVFGTEDAKEGPKAFAEKRKPNWQKQVSVDPRSPCIIGVAQMVSRPENGPAPEPLTMWERTCRDAAADAGATAMCSGPSSRCRSCTASRGSTTIPRVDCALPSASSRSTRLLGIGGTTPQVLVDHAAEAIVDGDLDVAIVCGAEALDNRPPAQEERREAAVVAQGPRAQAVPFEAPFHPAEVALECSRRTRRSRCGTSLVALTLASRPRTIAATSVSCSHR